MSARGNVRGRGRGDGGEGAYLSAGIPPPQPPAVRRKSGRGWGPGGNGIGGPERRKIGRIGGPTVVSASGGKVKMCMPTV